MRTAELTALAALTFNWTRALDDVWTDQRYHVDGLHAETADLIREGIRAVAADDAKPLGLVIQGERGVGKTHLLGWTREQVQRAGGYFFLIGDLFTKAFWEQVLGSVVEQLLPLPDGSRNQLATLLAGLADRVGLDGGFRAQVTGQVPPSPDALKVFVAALRRTDPSLGLLCQDTVRALALLASPLQEDQDVGYYYLTGNEVDLQDRRRWKINSTRKTAPLLVREVSQLLALTGPIVIAIDQIDALIDELVGVRLDDAPQSRPLADVATGLMSLRDVAHRTLTVVSCLPESWDAIRRYGVGPVADRFRVARQMRNVPSAHIGRLMIAKRFAMDFARVGFEPPYPTWPILPAAFDDASKYTARALLRCVETHVGRCLRERSVVELDRLDEAGGPGQSAPGQVAGADSPDLAALDDLFAKLREQAVVGAALSPETEDAAMPPLLAAGLEAWARETHAQDDRAFVQDPLPGKNPRLHACLRMLLDTRTERQRRWAFRAIASGSARAVQTRLKKSIEGAGLAAGGVGDAERRLFVLRSAPWPNGPVTEKAAAEFAGKGGQVLAVTEADLKTFAALGELLGGHHAHLDAWLLSRRPAHGTELLRRALGDAAGAGDQHAGTEWAPSGDGPDGAAAGQEATADPGPSPLTGAQMPSTAALAVHVGLPAADRPGANLDLASLRRHLAIFAGSGSGKTVLLRRVIEECALQGVSSIVLDPNNDLARLGDPWPSPPDPWLADDAERARDYLDSTDVIIWTPRREGGRPLSFRPLPDFGAVLDDIDEFNAAVDAAVEALAPRVGASRAGGRASLDKAVLTEAMRYFARGAGHDLGRFIALLADLPEHVSEQTRGPAIAADLADRLRAVRATDPLFAGAGEAADPGLLLTPPPGRRARISVISRVGMTSSEQWQGFVSQLQMALFAWVKRNPAGDRALGALLVMDEAQELVPSAGTTASSESTRMLAAQARKYGLGLLFATQSPKSLHNSIPGNATTQFFGLLNAPAQIEAARELARAKGGDVPAVGRLSAGQFYLATEGSAFRRIRTPMCLSHHPSSPLTTEEVIARAAGKSALLPLSAGHATAPVTGKTGAMPTFAEIADQITIDELRARGSVKWTRGGPGVIGAFVAEMDFGAAPPIEEALRDVIRRADFGYLSPRAVTEMAGACARWQDERYGWPVDPDRVRPLPDVIKGLEAAITVFSAPGTPVILPTPAYMPFLIVPRLLGREIIQVPMASEGGRAVLDLEGIDAAFRRGGQLLILCNPCNPLGRVYTTGELAALAAVVEANHGRVFADEIHAPLVYPGQAHVPYASVSEQAAGHTVTATAASKGWNLPGLKCAQLILSNDADAATWVKEGFMFEHGASTPGVWATAAAYRDGGPWLDEVLAYLDGNRKLLGALLAEQLPDVRYQPPEGTYLAWLDCRDLLAGPGRAPAEWAPPGGAGLTGLADFFLAKAQVLLTDGAACGDAGQGHVRLNFATPRPILTEIVHRLAGAVASR